MLSAAIAKDAGEKIIWGFSVGGRTVSNTLVCQAFAATEVNICTRQLSPNAPKPQSPSEGNKALDPKQSSRSEAPAPNVHPKEIPP